MAALGVLMLVAGCGTTNAVSEAKPGASTPATPPQSVVSQDDLARLGYCISNFITKQDRVDKAEVWATTYAQARAALNDYVPNDDPSGPNILMVVLTGKIVSDVWTGSEWKVEDQVYWTTPAFASQPPLDVGQPACDGELTQSGVPEHGIDRAVLGEHVDLPVDLIPESPNE